MTGPVVDRSQGGCCFERTFARIAGASAWLEARGFRVRRADQPNDLFPSFSVTATAGRLTVDRLLDLARSHGWVEP